jgi:phosphoheptose isomerase
MNKDILISGIIDTYNYQEQLKDLVLQHDSIIILGNGGSSGIASHICQDYTKVLKKRSFTISDASRLTCYTNDYGYDKAYLKFLQEFTDMDKKLLLILISSSGNSNNIIECANWAKDYTNISVITLTGFDVNNKLKTMDIQNRKINYWIDSTSYGIVECVHMVFLHNIMA